MISVYEIEAGLKLHTPGTVYLVGTYPAATPAAAMVAACYDQGEPTPGTIWACHVETGEAESDAR